MAEDIENLRVRRALDTLEAVARVGEDLLGRAVDLAPVEEGTLRGSAELALLVNGTRYAGPAAATAARAQVAALARAGTLKTIDAEVAFTTVYAAAQHEGLTFRHPLGGQAKYLEAPLHANAERYGRIIGLASRRATG
jgi:hypothetical protein